MLKKSIIRIISFALIIFVLSFFLYSMVIPQYYLPIFPFVVLFFVLAILTTHIVILKSSRKKARNFANSYLGSTALKLFAYMIFILIYVFADRENAFTFIINFLLLYFLFTAFEVVFLLKDLKEIDNSNAKE